MGSQQSYTWLAARFANISRLKVQSVRPHGLVNRAFLIPIMTICVNAGMRRLPLHFSFLRELQQRGFQGGLSIVKDFVTRLRRGLPGMKHPPRSLTTKRVPPMLSPRELRWLLAKKEKELTTEEKQSLVKLEDELARDKSPLSPPSIVSSYAPRAQA